MMKRAMIPVVALLVVSSSAGAQLPEDPVDELVQLLLNTADDLLGTINDLIGPPGCIRPGPPTDLLATQVAGGYELTWTAPTNTGSDPLTAYHIYRIDADPIDTLTPIVVGPATTSYTDPGGPAWTAIYIVVSVNKCGEGGFSDPTFVVGGRAEAEFDTPDYPHCIVLAIINPPQAPYYLGPFAECLTPVPGAF